MNDFDYEVLQKKRIAQSARHRKIGSKSKKCSLPSDGMTHKQWKERNGEVMSYNLNAPMKWKDFKYMPKDLQEQYLEKLRDEHGALQRDVANMLGITPNAFSAYVRKRGIDLFCKRKSKSTDEVKWNAFLNGDSEEAAEQSAPAAEELTEEAAVEAPVEAKPEPAAAKKAAAFTLDNFTLEFSGEFDPDAIRNSLAMILQKGQRVRIQISCQTEGD
jgi:hypothetical protein